MIELTMLTSSLIPKKDWFDDDDVPDAKNDLITDDDVTSAI